MVIANPIYDVVFKRLMENDRVAKFFIGTLLEQTIESVEVKPQEFTFTEELRGVALFRLDFIATVKTGEGEQKKVLIEIQKARNEIDLMRFRNYLAEQYKREDTVEGEKTVLPITTIYILGFKLPEITTPCLKVERNYRDLVERKFILSKSDFVEKLTHDSFIVQVDRIAESYQTKLDKLLSLFEQRHFVDDRKIVKEFRHEVDSEDLKIATDILHYAGTDPAERRKLETEQEAWRSIDALFATERKKFQKELADHREALAENEKALAENEKALAENEKALAENEKELAENKKTIEEMAKELEELKRRLGEK